MKHIPLINGVEYDFADITVGIGGVVLMGITKINYSDKKSKTNHYGAGRNYISRSYGRYEAAASIGLTIDEIRALQMSVPTRQLTDVPPFDITVVYLPKDAVKLHTDIIRNAEFVENKRELSGENDGVGGIELELIVSHINWNV